MRKRLVRNGLRSLLFSLVLIILVSFFHSDLAVLLSFSMISEHELYGKGIFFASAIGGFGVIVTVFGLIFSPDKRDVGVKIMPVFLILICCVVLFFYLLVSSFNSIRNPLPKQPDTTIII